MAIFKIDSIGTTGDKWSIRLTDKGYNTIGSISGSYNIIQCRLFGLTPAQYLRFIRDQYGAVLSGKKGYVSYYFSNETSCKNLIYELNSRWDRLILNGGNNE